VSREDRCFLRDKLFLSYYIYLRLRVNNLPLSADHLQMCLNMLLYSQEGKL